MGIAFFFEEGTVVLWGTSPNETRRTLERLEPYLNNPLPETRETMKFRYAESAGVERDIIRIKAPTENSNTQYNLALTFVDFAGHVQSKWSFSYALHQSVKVRDFEVHSVSILLTT